MNKVTLLTSHDWEKATVYDKTIAFPKHILGTYGAKDTYLTGTI